MDTLTPSPILFLSGPLSGLMVSVDPGSLYPYIVVAVAGTDSAFVYEQDGRGGRVDDAGTGNWWRGTNYFYSAQKTQLMAFNPAAAARRFGPCLFPRMIEVQLPEQ